MDLQSFIDQYGLVIILIIFALMFINKFIKAPKEEEEPKTPYEIVSYATKQNYLQSMNVLGTTIQDLGFVRGVLYYGYVLKGEIIRIWTYDYKYKEKVLKTKKRKVAGQEIEETYEDYEERVVPFIALEVIQPNKTPKVKQEGFFARLLSFLVGERTSYMGEIYVLRRDLIDIIPNYMTRELLIIIPKNLELINYNGVWVINDAKNRLHPEAVSERIKLNEISAQLTILPVKMAYLNENIASAMAVYEKQKEMLEFQKQLREETYKKEL